MNPSSPPDRLDLVEVVHVLVVIQAAVLVALTIEAVIFATAFPGAGPSPALMTGATAIAALCVAAGLGHRARWARRLAMVGESAVVLVGVADSVLGLLTGTLLPPPVAVLTRLVLPIAIIVLLRRSEVRHAFGASPPAAAVAAASGVGL